jgi:four helix bundle protein
MRLFSFEKLDVWKLSIKLTKLVYKLTKTFPDDEKFGLTSQIRRASVSIASNLAEGSSRISGKEQARFSEISYGSLHEVLNQLIIANELEYISDEELDNFRPLIEEIANKINSLRNYQLNKSTTNQINK